ncbi:MAG: hypothetical protein AAF960_04475 [Bacteroidota bacterium]
MPNTLTIFQLVCGFMFLVFLLGGIMASWYFVRLVGKREANLLLSIFLGVLALSLLHNLLINIGIFNHQPRYYFIPIWYTLSFGPLLFFFVKSRLFRPFHLQKKDFKHFIIPLLQATFYLFVGFRDEAFKAQLWDNQYVPLYRPIEGLIYIVGFSAYLYFSYRFVRFKLTLLERKRAFLWELDKVKRLKRMVKGLILLFAISAAAIVGDFLTYRFLGVNLHNLRGFTYVGDLSFTFLVLWVSYYAFRNAFFPSRHRLDTNKTPKLLLQKIDDLFQREKIFMDDELDRYKLSYYLKVGNKYLKKVLANNFRNYINKCRIAEAKNRIAHPQYKDYSIESIGLDVGFGDKWAFKRAFKAIEKRSLKQFVAEVRGRK